MKKYNIFLIFTISINVFARSIDISSIPKTYREPTPESALLAQKANSSGISFNQSDNTYQLIQGGYAIQNSDNKNTALSYTDNDKSIGTKSHYHLFIDNSSDLGNFNQLQQKGLSIALNQRTDNIVILTGKLMVKFKDFSKAQKIAENYGIQISDEFPTLKTVFYNVGEHNLFDMANTLRQDKELISSVEIDMIEYIMQPM